jgi:lysozyme family protein
VSGINSGAFPVEFASITALSQADRGPAIEQFYRAHFYNQWLAQIVSLDVQERIFDCAVNMGMGTAVKIAQTAVNSFSATTNQLVVDGGWGPKTVAAINAVDPKTFVAAFCAARVAHLQKYDAASPYLAQLIARAEK